MSLITGDPTCDIMGVKETAIGVNVQKHYRKVISEDSIYFKFYITTVPMEESVRMMVSERALFQTQKDYTSPRAILLRVFSALFYQLYNSTPQLTLSILKLEFSPLSFFI